MLLDSNTVTGNLRESLEAIKVCGEHMLELVNNVLDIGKIEAKKLSLESIPFRPMDEVDAVLKIFCTQAEQKKIRVEKVVSMDHPTRLGDPLRFRQVLFNLLSNALKFTEEGGRVYMRLRDDGEDIHTEVEDTGAGIPQDQISCLFEVNTHARTHTTRHTTHDTHIRTYALADPWYGAELQPRGCVDCPTVRRVWAGVGAEPADMRVDGRPDPLHVLRGPRHQVRLHREPVHPRRRH